MLGVFSFCVPDSCHILPNTDVQGATQLAEAMREAVKALEIAHRYSAAGSLVSISLGIATRIPGPNSGPEGLLAEADKQLYLAKQSGRDRVCAIELA